MSTAGNTQKFETIKDERLFTINTWFFINLEQIKNIENWKLYDEKIVLHKKSDLYLKWIGKVEKDFTTSFTIDEFKELKALLSK